MPLLAAVLLLAASFCLGAIPLTSWIVGGLTGRDLRQLGTGNVGVSAAFIHGGKIAGIAAVLAEISRGIAPVFLAKVLFPSLPVLAIAALIALVAGRYLIARGGGVTNATWGVLAYSPPVAIASGLTGLFILGVGAILGKSTRLLAVRLGCISGPMWVFLWYQSPLEFVATALLAGLLVTINLYQVDDMALTKTQGLLSLNESLDPKICGEKASRLSQLKKAGFNIPPGWVLEPSVETDRSLLLTLKSQLPDPLIVRSSARGEDSDTSSAAGQYETIGPVTTETALMDAIHRCRQSYQTPEAIAYRRQRQMPEAGMAVLIQPYINSQVAGVMFSRNPLDGGPQVIIEALPGGAEAVVGGQVTPCHLEIDFETAATQEASVQEAKNQSILPLNVLDELIKIAQNIEAFFHGLPQDIEWGWDGETIWILQSRPITNLRPIWTRTIAAEVIPGAIRPLTWSINRPLTCGVWGEIFRVVLGEKAAHLDFNETATLLGSHAYFNATLLGEIFRMMGLPEQGLEFLVRGQKMGKPPLGKVLPSLPGLWRLVQRERQVDREFERDRVAIFLPALERLDNSEYWKKSVIERDSLPALLRQAEQIQEILKPITYYNILGPIGLAIRTALFRIPDEWLPKETAPEIASVRQLQKLADRLRQVALSQSSNPPNLEQFEQLLDEDLSLKTAFQEWLHTYGYLSEVGTDIAVLTWREQPDTFRQLLLSMAQKPAETMGDLGPQIPRSWVAQWRLSRCYERALVKGQIGEIYGRLLAHLRWTFLAIESYGLDQKIFESPGDIFYLRFAEIQEWIRGEKDISFGEIVRQRRDNWQRDRDRVVPTVVYGNLLPELRNPSLLEAGDPSRFQGIPASVGCVEGFVKVYRSLTEMSGQTRSPAGEKPIVVVPYTDAGWAPLLLGAKAIIAEVGGQLSHGAIIAREYGIPAVMNIPQATRRLQDGQRVRVDGYRGTVEVIDA